MYNEEVVKLTGLPRYDNLYNNDQKLENIIALMPTWRGSLAGGIVVGTQNRKYNPKFKESDYYKFYNSIINDKKLLKILKEEKYKILFCIHPSLKAQIKDFNANEFVEIKTLVNYPEIFKKSKIMITDYSSVFFDFAYLKKPIIYAQFDFDDIFKNHIYTGSTNFDYKKDGFGKVLHKNEELINEIIDLIKNNCKMEEKYIKRVDKFFEYSDNNNCERVYNEIIKLLED